MIDTKNYSAAYVVMYKLINSFFLLEQEDGSFLVTPMARAHSLHPIKSMSRNKHRNLWVG